MKIIKNESTIINATATPFLMHIIAQLEFLLASLIVRTTVHTINCVIIAINDVLELDMKHIDTAIPVSYTHLDVYKRQHLQSRQTLR